MKFLILSVLFTSVCIAGPKRGVIQSVDYYYDYSISGGVTGTYNLTSIGASLPVSGVVLGMLMQVVEPLTSSGAASISIGNGVTNSNFVTDTAYTTFVNNYTKNHEQIKSDNLWDQNAKKTTPYLLDSSSKAGITMTIGTQPLTAGKYYLHFDVLTPSLY